MSGAATAVVLPRGGRRQRGARRAVGPVARPGLIVWIARYALSVGAIVVAVLLKLSGLPIGRETPFLLLFGAVILAAWLGGRGPAILALVLATVAADYFFLPPYRTFTLTSHAALELVVFASEAALMGAVTIGVQEGRLRERRAFAEAEAERRRFESVLMDAPVAVGVYSGPDHVVRLVNARWHALGKAAPEPLGKPLREVLPEAAGHGIIALLDEVYRTGEPREQTEFPIRFVDAKGAVDVRYYNVGVQPLRDTKGRVTDIVTVIADVTDLVAAERAIEEARETAERTSRAKDDFLRIAAHELRTPLAPIVGWAQILKTERSRDPERLRQGLDVILRNAREEARIVRDLLDVSRAVAGTMELTMEQLALDEIVRSCVDEMQPSAAAKGIAIEASIARAASLTGDASRLGQLVHNLLSNAIKFTPAGGRIAVELVRAGEMLVLTVRDTGKGIPAGELLHLFEPFNQADKSTTRREGGLGLGLALSKHIVEGHGGTVRAESAGIGRGAAFVVELPVSMRDRVDRRARGIAPAG